MEGVVKHSEKRLSEIDCLRGIAILLVVIGHSFFDKNDLMPQSVIFKTIYNFHMPLLFIISGFCFLKYAGNGVVCLKNKIRHILIPYLSLSFVAFFAKNLFSDVAKNTYPLKNWWRILVGVSPMWPLWFLWTAFAAMALYSFAYFKKPKLNYLIIFPLSFAVYLFYPMTGGALDGVLKLCRYQFYFLIGLFLRNNYGIIYKFANNIKDVFKTTISAVCVIIVVLIAFFNPFADFNRAVTIIISTILGLTGFYFLSLIIAKSRLLKMFTQLSVYSMDIYILSYFVILFLEIFYRKIDTASTAIYWVFVFSCIILSLVVPYFLSKYVIRKIPVLRTLVLGYVPVK